MRLHFPPVMSFCLAAMVLTSPAFSQEKAGQTAPFIGGKTGNEREEKIFGVLHGNVEIDFLEIRMEHLLAESAGNYRIQFIAGMKGDPEKNFEKLVHVLKTVIDPKSWASNGGKGGAAEIDGLLFVFQNSENHERIEGALTTLLRESDGN